MAGSEGGLLITNGTATSALKQIAGGIYMFAAVGTFNGATINLQFLAPDGTTLLTAGTATTLTAAGGGIAYLAPGQVQATVTGGPPSGIYASIARVVR
jgi:hypothetical protein